MKSILPLLLLFIAATPTPHAAEPPAIATAELSPETRSLLIEEMRALASAMGVIHQAIVTGNHETVGQEAQKIMDSFVLAQSLTADQRHELHTRLPAPFVAADSAFHELAGRLSQAGGDHDPGLQRYWFEEMTRACQDCHATFAAERFPGLTAPEPKTEPRHEH